jgi:hypothetical protein
MTDEEVIPFLLSLRRPTFFTLDRDFYSRELCHARYCLVFLDVAREECALFVRRVLAHPEPNTHAQRMGTVVRVSHPGPHVWALHAQHERALGRE